MILEFAGLPGCGKTTAEEILRKELEHEQIDFISRRELEQVYLYDKLPKSEFAWKLLRLPARLLFWFSIWFKSFRHACRDGTPFSSFQPSKAKPAYWLCKDLLLSNFFNGTESLWKSTHRVYCPSEGMLQHAAAVQVWNKGCRSLIEDTMAWPPAAKTLVVYFRLPVREGFNRFWERGIPLSWPASHRERPQAFDVYLEFEKILESTIAAYETNGVEVVRVDSSGDLEDLQRQVSVVAQSLLTQVGEKPNLAP